MEGHRLSDIQKNKSEKQNDEEQETEMEMKIFNYFELSQHVDENASVKGGLAVDRGDEVGYALEGERVDLLHNLGRPLHLLALERH